MKRTRTICVVGAGTTILLLLAAKGVVGTWSSGSVASISDVPRIGTKLPGLEADGPVHYAYRRNYRGYAYVVTGSTSKPVLIAFCRKHDLKLEPEHAESDRSVLVRNIGGNPPSFPSLDFHSTKIR